MVIARKSKLIEYKEHLIEQRYNLIDSIEEFKRIIPTLEWHDTQRDVADEAVNAHIQRLNKLISALDRSIAQLNDMIEILDDYFRSVKRLDR